MYKILWVCRSFEDCVIRREQFGQGEGVTFIAIGGALVGFGFDEVIIDVAEPFHPLKRRQVAREQAWFDHLRTKLYPKGRIYKLTDDQI